MAGTNLFRVPATIGSGNSLSAAVKLNQMVLVGFIMPAGWDAADLTFQASSDDGTTFGELFGGSGSAVQYQVAAGNHIGIDPTPWRGKDQVKLRSGTAGATVNQTADRTIILLLKVSA